MREPFPPAAERGAVAAPAREAAPVSVLRGKGPPPAPVWAEPRPGLIGIERRPGTSRPRGRAWAGARAGGRGAPATTSSRLRLRVRPVSAAIKIRAAVSLLTATAGIWCCAAQRDLAITNAACPSTNWNQSASAFRAVGIAGRIRAARGDASERQKPVFFERKRALPPCERAGSHAC